MRMQLRLRNFFLDVMAGGATARSVQEAAEGKVMEPEDPLTPIHSTAHMHVTWTDFLGFSKVGATHTHIFSTPSL
jgi:hypothetical protein